jgi:hypothetical protein
MVCRYILWHFGIIYGHLVSLWSNLVCLEQDKSGNPALKRLENASFSKRCTDYFLVQLSDS